MRECGNVENVEMEGESGLPSVAIAKEGVVSRELRVRERYQYGR